jgi:hypothetical protein
VPEKQEIMSFPSVPVPGEGSTTVIISWFLLVVSAMAIFTRLATKWATRRTFNLDDCLAVAALVSVDSPWLLCLLLMFSRCLILAHQLQSMCRQYMD